MRIFIKLHHKYFAIHISICLDRLNINFLFIKIPFNFCSSKFAWYGRGIFQICKKNQNLEKKPAGSLLQP